MMTFKNSQEGQSLIYFSTCMAAQPWIPEHWEKASGFLLEELGVTGLEVLLFLILSLLFPLLLLLFFVGEKSSLVVNSFQKGWVEFPITNQKTT